MMKNNNKLFLLIIIFSIKNYGQTGNVGINTVNPEKELHVNGSTKTNGYILKDNLEVLGGNENYSFLIKSPAPENKITTYGQSASNSAPAPLNTITFKITCASNDKDYVNGYDTRISVSKYTAVVTSYGFVLPVVYSNQSNNNPAINFFTPAPRIFAYTQGGTWWIRADYEGFKPATTTAAGVWTINMLLFDNAYVKKRNVTQDMGQSGTGAAASPIFTY